MATTTSQINEIKEDLSDAYTALGAKGATLPESNARGTANLASTINSLPKEGFPNKLWDVDANGVTTVPTGTFSEDSFDDIVEISSSKTLANAFKNVEVNRDITFRNLTTIGNIGLQYSFGGTKRPSGSSKFNISFPNVTSIGHRGCNQLAYNSSAFGSFSCAVETLTCSSEFKEAFRESSIESLSFPNLTSINTTGDAGSFYLMCVKCTSLKSVSFPNLTTITTPSITSSEASLFGSAFSRCTSLTSISFPELTTITGDSSGSYDSKTFTGVCQECTALLTASFPKLTTISGSSYAFRLAFSKCSALTSVDFSSLKTVGSNCFEEMCSRCVSLTSAKFDSLEEIGVSVFSQAFYGCKALTSISFPSLTTVGSSSFQYCFSGCTGLTTISFPSLTTVKSNSFTNCFNNCTALTEIHFPAAIQSTIEATTGYSSKWGATNATIYFDL